MPDSSVPINAPTTVGQSMASFTDAGGDEHEKIIVEYIDGTGQPQKVDDSTHPLPVEDTVAEAALTALVAGQQSNALTDAELRATPVPISGSVTVTGGGDATAANQVTGNTSLSSIDGKLINPLPVSGTVNTGLTQPLTDTQLRATAVPVSGTVATGGLTDTQLRATAVPVSGTVAVTGVATEATLLLIKNTDGVKKITDALPVGANVIGKVSIDQATPGTTNLVALSAETTKVIGTVNNATGSNIIGKVGIDQTTPGTTNAVVEASAAAILAKLTAAAASFVKLEDVASVDADAGVPMLAVRQSTPANTSGSNGDYEFLQMNAGKLWVQAGATQKPSIGATVVLAVTALQSLASSATVGWKSVRTSNLSTLANDYEVFISLSTAASAPANDKAVYLFVIPWYTTDAGSTWFASSGGTATLPTSADATYTIASPHNFRLLGVLNYTTTSMTLQDTFLLSNCFGNRLPDGFSFCVINFSGAALGTGCVLDISPVNDILV